MEGGFQIKTTSGTLKYTKLPPLIKAILAFQNGNATVEWSLSDNKNSVTSERTDLMDKTIVGLRHMKEYGRKHGGAHKVPITTEMINGMKEAKRMDDQHLKEKAEKKKLNDAEKEKLEEAKKQAEANLQLIHDSKKTLEDQDKDLEEKEKKAREALDVAQELLKHGTDTAAIGVATVMIQSSQDKMKVVNEQLQNLDKERKRIRKRKTELLESCEVQLKKKKKD